MSLFKSDDLQTSVVTLKPGERNKVKLVDVKLVEKDGKNDLVFKFKGIDPSNSGVFEHRVWNNQFDPKDQRNQDQEKFIAGAKRLGQQILHIVHAYVPTVKDANGIDVPTKIDADTADAFGYGNDYFKKVVSILTPDTYKDVEGELKLVVSSYNNKLQLPLWDFLSTERRTIELRSTDKDCYTFVSETEANTTASPFTQSAPPSPIPATAAPTPVVAPAFGQSAQ